MTEEAVKADGVGEFIIPSWDSTLTFLYPSIQSNREYQGKDPSIL